MRWLLTVALAIASSATSSLAGHGDAPRMKLGSPSIRGDLDKSIILRYMIRRRLRLTRCYQGALERSGGARGVVNTTFVIASTGAVVRESVVVSGFDGEMDQCIARSIQAMRFPASAGGGLVEVTLPISFSGGK